MIPKKNKYVKSVLLLILASCSSTPINLVSPSDQSYTKVFKRDLQDIRAYNTFFKNDLEIMQSIIDDPKLSQNDYDLEDLFDSSDDIAITPSNDSEAFTYFDEHFSGSTLMQNLLESEGVKIQNDRVLNFKKVVWDPSKELN